MNFHIIGNLFSVIFNAQGSKSTTNNIKCYRYESTVFFIILSFCFSYLFFSCFC